ncbi:hypothetical protein [Corynebacterium suranareeae]|nr:hypothetical protein [Corynebacterium suranareeae]
MANWKKSVAHLDGDQCEIRWGWMTVLEEQRFLELEEADEDAFIEFSVLIESACLGILNPDQTRINFPLNKNYSRKWSFDEVPWIGEWKVDSFKRRGGCYRIYFTDVLDGHDGVFFPMIGLLFREYPQKNLKFEAQSADIDRAITLAMKHQREHHCVLRTMWLR